jgi:hypothetical protein
MSEVPPEAADPIREQADAIVTQGEDIRPEVARLVTQTAEKGQLQRQGLIGLARSVLEGAQAAINRAVGHDPDSVLRQVVDGLGDGFTATALACKLAFEEARAQGKTFASEDLARMGDDLKGLRKLFVETVSTTAGRFRSLASGEIGVLRSHAEKTMERVLPALDSALSAAREHPIRLTSESAQAGFTMSRHALGALFSAVGHCLSEAGRRISGGPEQK